MGPRRSSLPTVSPASVIVEIHQFAGRWFVTGRWGQGSGIAVKRNVRKSALGKMVLDQAETARRGWRWRSVKALADEAELWERFCVGQAGVPMDRYLPEKRIVILVGQAGIMWHDASQSPPNWERLPDRSARTLGRALIRRMNQLGLSLPRRDHQQRPKLASHPDSTPARFRDRLARESGERDPGHGGAAACTTKRSRWRRAL